MKEFITKEQFKDIKPLEEIFQFTKENNLIFQDKRERFYFEFDKVRGWYCVFLQTETNKHFKLIPKEILDKQRNFIERRTEMVIKKIKESKNFFKYNKVYNIIFRAFEKYKYNFNVLKEFKIEGRDHVITEFIDHDDINNFVVEFIEKHKEELQITKRLFRWSTENISYNKKRVTFLELENKKVIAKTYSKIDDSWKEENSEELYLDNFIKNLGKFDKKIVNLTFKMKRPLLPEEAIELSLPDVFEAISNNEKIFIKDLYINEKDKIAFSSIFPVKEYKGLNMIFSRGVQTFYLSPKRKYTEEKREMELSLKEYKRETDNFEGFSFYELCDILRSMPVPYEKEIKIDGIIHVIGNFEPSMYNLEKITKKYIIDNDIHISDPKSLE